MRDRLEIIADIVSIARERVKRTQIMYKANLSYKLLVRYLTEVTVAGLLVPEDYSYKSTRKGKRFLERYRSYARKQKFLEKRILDVNKERMKLERMLRPI